MKSPRRPAAAAEKYEPASPDDAWARSAVSVSPETETIPVHVHRRTGATAGAPRNQGGIGAAETKENDHENRGRDPRAGRPWSANSIGQRANRCGIGVSKWRLPAGPLRSSANTVCEAGNRRRIQEDPCGSDRAGYATEGDPAGVQQRSAQGWNSMGSPRAGGAMSLDVGDVTGSTRHRQGRANHVPGVGSVRPRCVIMGRAVPRITADRPRRNRWTEIQDHPRTSLRTYQSAEASNVCIGRRERASGVGQVPKK